MIGNSSSRNNTGWSRRLNSSRNAPAESVQSVSVSLKNSDSKRDRNPPTFCFASNHPLCLANSFAIWAIQSLGWLNRSRLM